MKKHKILVVILFLLTNYIVEASELRIDVSALNKQSEKYIILDARSADEFHTSHIENARNFDASLTYEHRKDNGKLTNPNTMQQYIRARGMDTDNAIVIYDNGNFFEAARLFWALEVYGFHDLKILNGGLSAWREKHFALTTKTAKITPSTYTAQINNKRLATKFLTQIAIKNPKGLIIDARDASAYKGERSSAKRFGHIPTAINIPAVDNVNQDKKSNLLKSKKSLEKLYTGINKNKKIIVYCALGRISSTNYFALRELGFDVANYDASWREWGNDLTLPIEK